MAYARDASIYRLLPDAVVRPTSCQDVKALLGYARQKKTPITFRAGGTSLSGQSISSGIVAEALYGWSHFQVLDQGASIRMQPGVNGGFANKILHPYGRRIGPDPASINAARIGGILANNASGMSCGTEYNSYHTFKYISFILPNGHEYNTKIKDENLRFLHNEPRLSEGLLRIRKEILSQPNLVKKIRRKYRIKNTIGYSMNSFLDYEDPLSIFSHLLIGAEGTLAFISEVTLNTVPDPPEKGTGLILFQSSESAGDSVPFFTGLGAAAVEILDDQSLRTAKHFDNPPYDPSIILDGCTALLVEFQDDSSSEIDRLISEVKHFISADIKVHDIIMVTNKKDRDTIWKIRKGLYPTLGALRQTGTSVITEDIAIDVENLAPAIQGLKNIFNKREFNDGVIFGHAKDGNLHFLTSIDLDNSVDRDNYEGMIDDLSDLTIGKFDGSLKAEHGTGRNMAPFVEKEWGGPIFDIMWQIKSLADPYHILNPDVLLSRDQKLHMKELKPLPKVHKEVDMCIECGFCEQTCPSSGLSLTPRQRINVVREIKLNNLKKKDMNNFQYLLDETCAGDGLCAGACPVNIDTGKMVKSIRFSMGKEPRLVGSISENIQFITTILNHLLKIINISDKIFGNRIIHYITYNLNNAFSKNFPVWPTSGIAGVKPLKFKSEKNRKADFIHFPTCVNRIFPGNNRGESASVLLHQISHFAGKKIDVLDNYKNLCCGMAFDSRGYTNTGNEMRGKLIKHLMSQSRHGKIPTIIDLSPCTQYILEGDIDNLQIMDSVTFMNRIKKDLQFSKLSKTVYAHPVCSSQKMGNSENIIKLAKSCSGSVETSMEKFCCAMAGDRGFRIPELSRHAIRKSTSPSADFGVSSSRTCEIALAENTGIQFISIEELVLRSISNSTRFDQ